MKLEQIINENYDSFSEGDQLLAKYILEHKNEIQWLSITQVAERSLSSKSSVLRFAQKLGFSGYTELKNFIKWGNLQIASEGKSNNYAEFILNHVEKTIRNLNMNEIEEISKKIAQSQNVYLAGTSFFQQNLATEMQRLFLKLGKNMHIIPLDIQTDLYQLVVEQMTEDDLLVIFSSSGNNTVIKETLSIPLIKKVKILSLTATQNNWLTNHADYSIHVFSDREEYSNYTGFYATSAFYCVIEILAYSFFSLNFS